MYLQLNLRLILTNICIIVLFLCSMFLGSLYDCPKERYIPIYLIVGGVFGVLKNVSSMVQRILNQKNEQEEDNAKTNPIDGILNCFLIGWFIAGKFAKFSK